jgi:hypothetical protein
MRNIFYFLIILLAASCAPSRFVKPLTKGEIAAGANLGGELIHFAGAVIPIPLTSVYAGYGCTDRTTVYGGIHTTSALFSVFQVDIGATCNVWQKDSSRTGFSVSPALNIAFDKSSFKLWPALDLNYYRSFGKKYSYWYAGVSNWFELSRLKAHGELQKEHWLFSPQAGVNFSKKNVWQHQVEMKFLGVNRSNKNIVVDYATPMNKGAIGIYYSIIRKF